MASKKDDGGLSDVLADMDSIKDIPRSEYVRSALLKSAKEFAGTAKALAPKDTGALADSVVVTGPGETTPPHSQPGASRVAGHGRRFGRDAGTEPRPCGADGARDGNECSRACRFRASKAVTARKLPQ